MSMATAPAAFNSDLYVVGATVIPVLFIALLIPEGVLARYAVWVKSLRSRQLGAIRTRHTRQASADPTFAADTETAQIPVPTLWGVLRLHDLLLFPVTAALLLFVGGEISAVHALDHRHASGSEHWWVEATLVALPVLACISVIASISFQWASEIAKRADRHSGRLASSPENQEAEPD